MSSPIGRILMAPDGADWAALARRCFSRLGHEAALFREELGIPVSRPVVMTGHQSEWWHCGVLAKFIATDVLATSESLGAAWVVPDQDEAAFHALRLPVRDAAGDIAAARIELTPPPPEGSAAGSCPPFRAHRDAIDRVTPPLDSIRSALNRFISCLDRHAQTPTAAAQAIATLTDLMEPWASPRPTVFASRIAGTAYFRAVVGRMAAHPLACAEAYNRAVAAHPEAGAAPLPVEPGGARVELPLWELQPAAPRRRVTSDRLGSIDPARLAPRALLLTGLMRAAACDLFVHGIGGAAYDRATERWFSDWLGVQLAPMTMATADVHLPLPATEVGESETRRAAWTMHAALHNPGITGNSDAQRHKLALARRIAEAPRNSPERRAAFRELHEVLATYRLRHTPELEGLREREAVLRRLASQAAVARDRTWAFFLHGPSAIDALRSCIIGCFAGVPCPSG